MTDALWKAARDRLRKLIEQETRPENAQLRDDIRILLTSGQVVPMVKQPVATSYDLLITWFQGFTRSDTEGLRVAVSLVDSGVIRIVEPAVALDDVLVEDEDGALYPDEIQQHFRQAYADVLRTVLGA